MSGKGLAGTSLYMLIRIAPELLKHLEDARLVDRRRAVAKHVNNPAANVWIRIVSHFENRCQISDSWSLNFTRTQGPNSFETCFGVPVPAQFEQARNF